MSAQANIARLEAAKSLDSWPSYTHIARLGRLRGDGDECDGSEECGGDKECDGGGNDLWR